jgi:ADP-ribose pyrophosphatase YjhB (NUDIX family)
MNDRQAQLDFNRLHTRVAAYALCTDNDGKLLICRVARGYPSAGMWTLPGGGINFGEHPADAALRELGEETGLTGRIESLAFVDSWAGEVQRPTVGPWHSLRIVYRVTVTGGTLRDEQDESTDMAAWFSLSDVASMPIVDLVELTLRYLAGEMIPRQR